MIKQLIYIFIFVSVFLSCKKENCFDCVKPNGKIIIQKRDVTGFNCIHLTDKMDVYLTQAPDFKVEVEAGKNIQALIKTELDGETLKVVNTNRCNWIRGYKHRIKIYISAPYFKYIENEGVGTIQSVGTITQDVITIRTSNTGDLKLNLNTNSIMASAHGGGDTYLSGTTQNLASDFTGTNYLYANDLTVSNYVFLHDVSIGHAYINAPEGGLMDIIIERDGNIYYKGNPTTVNAQTKGKGKLIKE